MDVSFPDMMRLHITLLDAELNFKAERMRLAEGCGWTVKYVWDLAPGDEAIDLNGSEGPVASVETGPFGSTIKLDLGDGEFATVTTDQELVRVAVGPTGDAF